MYRGPASLPGCPEAVASLLSRCGLSTAFVGPGEQLKLSAESLAGRRLYAQPGGPDLDVAWAHLGPARQLIRAYVAAGGSYLGFCLGGYTAGSTPGFGLIPGDTDQFIDTQGACHSTTEGAVVTLAWDGRPVRLFFQDGPYFHISDERSVRILARYSNGLVAALSCRWGEGAVAVVGPHPEATPDWFADEGLPAPSLEDWQRANAFGAALISALDLPAASRPSPRP